jgi:hypothetical protein
MKKEIHDQSYLMQPAMHLRLDNLLNKQRRVQSSFAGYIYFFSRMRGGSPGICEHRGAGAVIQVRLTGTRLRGTVREVL